MRPTAGISAREGGVSFLRVSHLRSRLFPPARFSRSGEFSAIKGESVQHRRREYASSPPPHHHPAESVRD
jgi:hypothetical protein